MHGVGRTSFAETLRSGWGALALGADEDVDVTSERVGLLGEKRPRALPPMEIIFTDHSVSHPVYSYGHKKETETGMRFEVPARVVLVDLDTRVRHGCRVGRIPWRSVSNHPHREPHAANRVNSAGQGFRNASIARSRSCQAATFG